MEQILQKVDEISNKLHPRLKDDAISYGTAGFRTQSLLLDHIMFRSGLLAALRSKCLDATVGLMVTASHNPECDNGVKLVDSRGEMLVGAWEKYATLLANTSGKPSVIVKKIIDDEHINMSTTSRVVIARDTRESGKALSRAAIDGAEVIGAKVTDYGLLTTPQLHYMVRCCNDPSYGQPTEQAYYDKLITAFHSLNKPSKCANYRAKLSVDCANGIGAPKLQDVTERLSSLLDIHVVNNGSVGQLNDQCGADYVKIKQCSPQGIDAVCDQSFASFDGDADRIVYFYFDSENKFHLLDGDKIATLIASYLLDLIKTSGLPLNLGIVQTAYANGRSTRFMTQTLGMEVACVSTGVKHLHHRAQQFDVGVYFEANGHGTVLFSDETIKQLHVSKSQGNKLSDEQLLAVTTLYHVTELINQTVGDALSDMLIVETILRTRDLSLEQWDQMYTDFPNRQLKVKVTDRNVVTTTDADRKVVMPHTLQSAIDKIVTTYTDGRSFVRASGTEDVVRVYAEADTQENADRLGSEVARKVYDLCGGMGPRP